jgi:hypothetical protein
MLSLIKIDGEETIAFGDGVISGIELNLQRLGERAIICVELSNFRVEKDEKTVKVVHV